MQFNFGFATDIGRKRQQNQDNGAAHADIGLFVVADGMGGHRGGETASAMVAEIVPEVVRAAMKKPGWNGRDVIVEGIRTANNKIFERSTNQPQLQGMGTTTVGMLFAKNTLSVGHVGDSRCYFFRPHAVWQVTRDHSLVQEKLRAGLITRAQLKTDRMKNVITRSVGFEEEVNVEVFEMGVQVGDIFLLCSDGLSGLIEDSRMLEIIQKRLVEGKDMKKCVEELIESANNNGGDDNITAIVVQVTALDPEAKPAGH